MNLHLKAPTLLLLLISLCFVSCQKYDLQEAKNSITGNWSVVEITSFYAEFNGNGARPIETISEQGQLGNFNFEEDSVTFTFTRNDTLFTGNSAWSFTSEQRQAGFVMEVDATLVIENEFTFGVTFEDGIINSEKNAQEVTFSNGNRTGVRNGIGVSISMILEKN
jgi:hypothetical protein